MYETFKVTLALVLVVGNERTISPEANGSRPGPADVQEHPQ